jgi:transcriptional regulator with XRE-family HTH domain
MSELVAGTPADNPVGDRLKAAREAKGMSLDDVAARTRVPVRHLQHIEKGEWDSLPAPTYSIGFARSYAAVVGLEGSEIGAQLREQLGGGANRAVAPAYEPADPARVPPRSLALVAAAIAILLAIGYMVWRSGAVDDSDIDPAEVVTAPADPAPAPKAAAAAQPQPAAQTGPVVLTAIQEVWLQIDDAGGARLYQGTLKAGERFEVPATAQRPQILTGRPDALRVTVGNTEIPQLGPSEKTISDVSLAAPDLLARLRQPAATPPPAAAVPPPGR